MNGTITKERALELHREMWQDMQRDLGDNPNGESRYDYKKDWCLRHGFYQVDCYCFLCEYVSRQKGYRKCRDCPIDWSPLSIYSSYNADCTDVYTHGVENIYKCAPISEILALPIKE